MLVTMTAAVIIAAGCLCGIPQAAADDMPCFSDTSCYFLSPTGNLSCEMHTDSGPATAYCQSNSAIQSVTMDADGSITPCAGNQCMGDPAGDTPTLAYGQTARLDPFDCLSTTDGVTCTVSSGQGFTISRDGVVPVG